MSRLVYKGDTINNFGRHLPVPYIERIEILNLEEGDITNPVLLDAGLSEATKITLYITLLFNTDDDFDVDAFKEEVFSELDLNVILLSKREVIEQLRDDKKNLKSLLKVVELATPVAAGLWQHQLLDLFTFIDTIAFTGDYDEDMNSVIRTTNIVVDLETARLDTVENLSVFVGTSVGDPADFAASSNVAYALNFSSLAYEHIFINSELATRDQIAFFTVGSEEFYSGVPLRAINKKYYKTEEFGPDDIKLLLNGVMNNYRNYVDTDEELRGALQNIEFIYARYGEDPSFLVELQKYSNMFPNRDVTTPTGNLYESFKRSIINSNTLLLNQPEVAKRLVRTTKIRDLRPIQFKEDFDVSYNEDLGSADILYEGTLHTNLAKYVAAPDSPEAGELYLPFEAEVPKTPQELTDEVNEALEAILNKISPMLEEAETFTSLKSRMKDEVLEAMLASVDEFVEDFAHGAMHTHRSPWLPAGGAGYSYTHPDREDASLIAWIGEKDELSVIPTLQFGFDMSESNRDPRELPWPIGFDDWLDTVPSGDGWGLSPDLLFMSVASYHNILGFEFAGTGVIDIYTWSDAGTFTYMDYDTDTGWAEVTVDLESWVENLTPRGRPATDAHTTMSSILDNIDSWHHNDLLETFHTRLDWVMRQMLLSQETWDSATDGYDMSTETGRSNYAENFVTGLETSFLATLYPLGAWSNVVLRLRTGRAYNGDGSVMGHLLTDLDQASVPGGAPHSACGGNPLWLNMLVYGTASPDDSDGSTSSGVCDGPGNWSYCLGTAAARHGLALWNETWRDEAKKAIERALELCNAYWGNTIGTGRHKKLAEVDIVVQKYGWYFFDMEKYIRHQSHLSRFMDVSKLINHFSFSRDMLNYTTRLAKSRCVTRPGPITDEGVIMRLRQDVSPISNMPSFDSMSFKAVGDYYHMKIPALDVGNWKDFVVNNSDEVGQTGAAAQSIDSTNIYAYLMLRNFDFPDNAPIDDNYRLMAFNYNYFMDDDEAITASAEKEQLSAMVTVEDNSILVLFSFGEYIRNVYAEFLTYYDLAKENCAYNRYDSQFNTFFADSMNDEYAGNLINAPWFRAPVVLALYRDLFANQFGGDMFYILENARKRSDNINPTTGYLEALEQFKEDFENLITHYEEIEFDARFRTSIPWGPPESSMPGGPMTPSTAFVTLPSRQTYVFGTYSSDLPDDNPELGTVNRGADGYFLGRQIIDFVGNYEDALPEVPSWYGYATSTAPPIEIPDPEEETSGGGAPTDWTGDYTTGGTWAAGGAGEEDPYGSGGSGAGSES